MSTSGFRWSLTTKVSIALGMLTLIAGVSFPQGQQKQQHPVPTWNDTIGPLIHERCVSCHRRGGVGPFRLDRYQDVKRRSHLVLEQVLERSMPPHFATSDIAEMGNIKRLNDQDLVDFQRWVHGESPEGEGSFEEYVYPGKWGGKEPDLILKPDVTPTMPTEGNPVWKAVSIQLPDRDLYVRGFTIEPAAEQPTKHVLLGFVEGESDLNLWETQGTIEAADQLIGSWAPAYPMWELPEGVAIKIPAGSTLIAQLLFQPSGREEIPDFELGLYLSEKPARQPRWINLEVTEFEIEPYDEPTLGTSHTFESDVEIINILPEARFYAYSMKAFLAEPEGEESVLYYNPRWDPYWTGNYQFTPPVLARKGSTIRSAIVYDNEEHSVLNDGQKPKPVYSGHGLYDEICRMRVLVVDRPIH